jgi:hypothetical protein
MEYENYNGWTNRETWAVKLHLDNTEGWQKHVYNLAEEILETKEVLELDNDSLNSMLAEQIEEFVTELKEQAFEQPTPSSEELMVRDVGSFWRVDYLEIARAFFEEVKN